MEPVENGSMVEAGIKVMLEADDANALELIWDSYGQHMLAFAASILCSHADAEEVVQEVFLKVARKPGRIARARSLKAYLFTMVRNESMTLLRRRKRASTVAAEDLWLVPDPHGQAPGDSPELIAELLARLSGEQREVIALKFFMDMTFREIGEALEIPPDTAASRYRYGMLKLRSFLMEAEHENA